MANRGEGVHNSTSSKVSKNNEAYEGFGIGISPLAAVRGQSPGKQGAREGRPSADCAGALDRQATPVDLSDKRLLVPRFTSWWSVSGVD